MKELTEPYLLYVGNIYPHKNIKRLILAFRKLIKGKKINYQLVIVGGDVADSIDSIFFTGFINDKELDALYGNASLFVFPSLYEGFGFPPLEAMTRGVAVVSSRAACLPEILGSAAVYFNPENVEDMMEKIYMVLIDEELRRTLIGRGFKQVENYSWGKTAEMTLEIYKNIPFR